MFLGRVLGAPQIRVADARLIEERLQRDGCRLLGQTFRGGRVGHAAVGHRSSAANASGDLFRQFLSIAGRLDIPRFGRIGEESAFHQHGWNGCPSQDEITAATDPAIERRRAARDVIMDGGGERKALVAVKIGFNAVGSAAGGGIEMDADENSVAVGVGDGDPRSQGDEDVGASRHDHSVSAGLQHAAEAQGHVQRHHAFGDALPGNSATIEAAMAGINDDDRA